MRLLCWLVGLLAVAAIIGAKPKFRFDRWISGRNVPIRGYNFTEILTDARGRRENDSQWSFRELLNSAGKPQRLEQPLGENDRFEFRSFGPLQDSAGKVIRVHHRVVAAPSDLDGDGRLDLILAGATYGSSDPQSDSGIRFVRNEGETRDHAPILSPVKPLDTIGHTNPAFKYSPAQLQSLDLLSSGEKVVVVGTQLGDIRSGGESLIARNAPVKIELAARTTTFQITVDRGPDWGQNFGSLFEVTSEDGSLVVGAGFQNVYNTRNRADRHALQFFVRPTDGQREFVVQPLPRPNNLCGTYLYARDETVHSTFGGLKAWDAPANDWRGLTDIGGTQEAMRVGKGLLEFGDSTVKYDGAAVLSRPTLGSFQMFFYANGYLCFYHVNRGDGGYRAYQNDEDGFSKLYACRWTPGEEQVDLSHAITMTLPVVGETTFAWGQLGQQIVTGSNIGGFYILEDARWRKLLEPNIKVSYQLYSTLAFHDRLLMGQYPTGRLFEFDGRAITDRAGWPPVLPGVTASAREAQTTVIYGGEPLVGVWPWGELWRFQPDARKWSFVRRMFDHPQLSDQIIHPYDVENRGYSVSNQWGQRVTSLVTSGPDLFVATSAKSPCDWDADKFPFLAPDKWKSYGAVYRLTTPGHLGASTAWTAGPTTFELTLRGKTMSISQDGQKLSETVVTGPLAERLEAVAQLKPVRWGDGIYGRFSGPKLDGIVTSGVRP